MTREEVFETWAPPAEYSVWSTWVKPVLFSQMPQEWGPQAAAWAVEEKNWPARLGRTALIVDLPGEESVQAGLSLARRGFRPVPLFNGVPHLPARPLVEEVTAGAMNSVAIDVWPIMRVLWLSANYLQELQVPAGAPPAFLLDSRRRLGECIVGPGVLDNRWLSFPTDFPSARMLLEQDIVEAVVITEADPAPAADLAHTLLRWQQAGIGIHMLRCAGGGEINAIKVERPGMFGAAWYEFLTMLGMRRSLLGGFGGRVPEPSSG